MLRSASRKWVAAALLVLMGVGLSVTPGMRHEHDGGDAAHSHRAGTHPHTHGPHGHRHPHSHAHSHGHGHSHTHGPRGTLAADESLQRGRHAHVHFSILGFEVTIPDFWNGRELQPAPAGSVATRSADGLRGTPVAGALTEPCGAETIVPILLGIRAPLPPGRVTVPRDGRSQALAAAACGLGSRGRDEPQLPPPRVG
jgi:hypothetical protein